MRRVSPPVGSPTCPRPRPSTRGRHPGPRRRALLATLEPAQAEDVIRSVTPGLGRCPHLDAGSRRIAVELARRTGAAIVQGTGVNAA